MKKTYWNKDLSPVETTLERLIYELRKNDTGLIFDAVKMADIYEDSDSLEVLTLDALISPFSKLDTKMLALQKVMERVGQDVKPIKFTISEPFTLRNTANVAVIFELSDGQTVSIFLRNSDVINPKKIVPADDMLSWKWMLNKKDCTVAVAPETGADLDIRKVAARIMKLAEKNSALFAKGHAKRAEQAKAVEYLKIEISDLENELKQAQNRLEVAKVEKDEREIAAIENPAVEIEPDLSNPIGDENSSTETAEIIEPPQDENTIAPEIEQGIDPVAKANIEAANITDTMKKNAIKYLNENPTSHQLFEKETPAGKKAYKSVMESIKTALLSEIKSLSMLFSDFNSGSKNSGSGVSLGFDDSSVIFTVDGDYKLSFWTRVGENVTEIFDSTSTLEELRQWGFALPFDLDVKAFVANVIKPVVDEFLALAKANGDNAATETETPEIEPVPAPESTKSDLSSIPQDLLHSIGMIMAIDDKKDGYAGYDRALFVSSLTGKLKTMHKNGQQKQVDDTLNTIEELQKDRKKPILAAKNSTWGLHSKYGQDDDEIQLTSETETSQPPESQTADIDAEINPLQNHIDALQSVIDGKHDDVDLTELLDMIDAAATAIIDAGSADEYDALIGDAATKWAALDEKKNG